MALISLVIELFHYFRKLIYVLLIFALQRSGHVDSPAQGKSRKRHSSDAFGVRTFRTSFWPDRNAMRGNHLHLLCAHPREKCSHTVQAETGAIAWFR